MIYSINLSHWNMQTKDHDIQGIHQWRLLFISNKKGCPYYIVKQQHSHKRWNSWMNRSVMTYYHRYYILPASFRVLRTFSISFFWRHFISSFPIRLIQLQVDGIINIITYLCNSALLACKSASSSGVISSFRLLYN